MSGFIQRRKKIDAGIDMTPLIDVVFQLLIFLMVSSHFIKPDKKVDLPAGASQTETHSQETKKHLVTITAENALILDGIDMSVDGFEPALKKLLSESETRRLEIRGDTASNLGTFITVLETAKALGVEGLSYHKKSKE